MIHLVFAWRSCFNGAANAGSPFRAYDLRGGVSGALLFDIRHVWYLACHVLCLWLLFSRVSQACFFICPSAEELGVFCFLVGRLLP